jgi:hypothetical protein
MPLAAVSLHVLSLHPISLDCALYHSLSNMERNEADAV